MRKAVSLPQNKTELIISVMKKEPAFNAHRVTLCQDGKYRWVYDVNLFTNPTVFFDVVKVMFISMGIVASGRQLEEAEERLAEMMPYHEVLWAYDIDAGLPSLFQDTKSAKVHK